MAGIADLRLRILPYTAEHTFRLLDVPTRHADPFDRQLIAQALVEDIAVVTPDDAFRLCEGLRVVWRFSPARLPCDEIQVELRAE